MADLVERKYECNACPDTPCKLSYITDVHDVHDEDSPPTGCPYNDYNPDHSENDMKPVWKDVTGS